MSYIEQKDVLEYIKRSRVTVTDLNEIIRAANKRLPVYETSFKVESLEDELKVEMLSKAYKKYSLSQLERRF